MFNLMEAILLLHLILLAVKVKNKIIERNKNFKNI